MSLSSDVYPLIFSSRCLFAHNIIANLRRLVDYKFSRKKFDKNAIPVSLLGLVFVCIINHNEYSINDCRLHKGSV